MGTRLSPEAKRAESVALSRGELLGMGPSHPTAQDCRHPPRGVTMAYGQDPISAWWEPAQHSAWDLVLASHTPFLCIFTAAGLVILM